MTAPAAHRPPATSARAAMSVTLSVALHAGGAAGWLHARRLARSADLRVLSNVELLVSVARPGAPREAPAAPRPAQLDTWKFLKMALPSIPKAAAPLEVKAQELARKALADAPEKLKEDRGRVREALEPALDLGRKRSAAQLDAEELQARRPRAVAAELPRLEEVGARRASKAKIESAELAEERRGRLSAMDAAAPPEPVAGRKAAVLAPLPEEASQAPQRGALRKLADMLASEELPRPREAAARPRELPGRAELSGTAELPARREAALAGQKKKTVELEGPIAGRRVVYYELPRFPQWAAAQGIVEADVKIRFHVTARGDVLPGMRVQITSGYGGLDRLAMEALGRWRFEPIAEGAGNQWGLITFRFLLE